MDNISFAGGYSNMYGVSFTTGKIPMSEFIPPPNQEYGRSIPFNQTDQSNALGFEALPQNQEYFTPSIEDIRVGYECEIEDVMPSENPWSKHTISTFDSREIKKLIAAGNIRVPYLTKEQIEAEGWIRQNNYFDETKKQRLGLIPDYELKTEFGSLRLFIKDLEKPYESIDIERYTKSDPNDPWSLSGKWYVYRGQCKDINTFRYICKLLNI